MLGPYCPSFRCLLFRLGLCKGLKLSKTHSLWVACIISMNAKDVNE